MNRKGKLRGGKLRQVPTDLSGVLDFQDRSMWHSRAVLVAHSTDLNKKVFGLASHPGPVPCICVALASKLLLAHLVEVQLPHLPSASGEFTSYSPGQPVAMAAGFYVICGAMSAEVQQHLIMAALQEYTEAPSNTNHTRHVIFISPTLARIFFLT
jgi:hypothetical protein